MERPAIPVAVAAAPWTMGDATTFSDLSVSSPRKNLAMEVPPPLMMARIFLKASDLIAFLKAASASALIVLATASNLGLR